MGLYRILNLSSTKIRHNVDSRMGKTRPLAGRERSVTALQERLSRVVSNDERREKDVIGERKRPREPAVESLPREPAVESRPREPAAESRPREPAVVSRAA